MSRVALAAPVGLAVVLGSLTLPGGAAAAPSLAPALNVVQNIFQDSGPATCSNTNPGDTSNSPFTVNGPTSTKTLSSTTTVTDTGDATDVTTAKSTVKSTVKTKRSGGTLTIDWAASVTQSTNAAQGTATDCDVVNVGMASLSTALNLTEASWMTVRGDVDEGGAFQVIVVGDSPATEGVLEEAIIYGGHSHSTYQFLLPAGHYIFYPALQGQLYPQQSASDPTSQTMAGNLDTTVAPAGSASGKAAGTGGTKYLKTKDQVDCGKDSLSAKWKFAAGKGDGRKVKKATFSVNGHKEKTVNRPKAGQTTKLTKLDTDEHLDLKVKLKLVGGGAVTLTQTYLSCT